MGISTGGSRKQRQSFTEINITPLTDVFLVLLVIMFLIAPLLDDKTALKIDPPAAKSAKNQDQEKQRSILIEVNKDGLIAVSGEQVAAPEIPNDQVQELVYKALQAQAEPAVESAPVAEGEEAAAPDKPNVKLKADNTVSYGRVIAVMDAINRAKLGKLSLVTTVPLGEAGK